MIPKIDKTVLADVIRAECDRICETFSYKNKSYGANEDAFHNFRSTAIRVHGNDSADNMLKTLLTYKDKHDVAIANRGLDDQEFVERCRDIAVYSLIAIGMHEARQNANRV